MKKLDIRNTDPDVLQDFLTENGEELFRARQINEWLWKKSATNFDSMTNLSLKIRDLLKKRFNFRPAQVVETQNSTDGTIKVVFQLFDENVVEGVLIPTKSRQTACISSQVGCSLSCKFCATGYMDRKRNLDAAEIYDQVVYLNQISRRTFNSPLTNIVFMGMGEPMLNYSNVLKSIFHISNSEGLNISAKRITVSTAGVAKMIEKLGKDNPKVNLALSLHAVDDVKRNEIMPINETNSIEALINALNSYYQSSANPITYEYILFQGFNDQPADAKELLKLVRRIPSKVNLIEFNPIDQASFMSPPPERVNAFRDFLEKHGVNVRIRRSRGKDINAACGQLANKH